MTTPALRLDHLAFPSFDVGATQRFYGETLGLPLVAAYSGASPEWGGRDYVMMTYALAGGRHLVFFGLEGLASPAADGLPRDIRHVALTVTSARDFARWKTRLGRRGVPYWEEDHGDQASIYFSDPNGHTFEITFPASRAASRPSPAARRLVAEWVRTHPARRARRRTRPRD